MLWNKPNNCSVAGRMMFVLAAVALLGQAMPGIALGAAPSSDEKFVPMGGSNGVAGTLEMRLEARVDSAEVRLRDVCRWNQQDDQAMAPVADLVITRLGSRTPYQAIGVEEIKSALREAGINLGLIRFSGSQVCTVGRSDPAADPLNASRHWGDAQAQAASEGTSQAIVSQPDDSIGNAMNAMSVPDAPPAMPAYAAQETGPGQRTGSAMPPAANPGSAYGQQTDGSMPAAANPRTNYGQQTNGASASAANTRGQMPERYDPVAAALHAQVDDGSAQMASAVMTPAQPTNAAPMGQDSHGSRTLKQALLADLAQRLNAPQESLLVEFRPEDEARLAMKEPEVRFDITSRRAATLGRISWDVVLLTTSGVRTQPMTLTAYGRQWQEQVVAARPVAYKQLLRAEDLVTRRVLVDQLNDSVLLTTDQVVGQMASVQIKPGVVFTARMVDPVPLVSTGQLVTITLKKGSFEIKTVGRAMEGGTYGQSIRVRNEVTRDVFQVVVTGPQTGSMSQPDSTGSQDVASASGL